MGRFGVLVIAVAFVAGCSVRGYEPLVVDRRAPRPPPPGAPPPPMPPPGAPPPPQGPPPDPEPARQLVASLGQPAVPFVSVDAPPRVTLLALDATARGEAAGKMPGTLATAVLGEGQRASMALSLAPGECTTVIAHGGLGVVELDLFVTTGSGDGFRIVSEDGATGPVAVVGGRSGCVAPAPGQSLTGELVARVRRGAGIVLVRAYR